MRKHRDDTPEPLKSDESPAPAKVGEDKDPNAGYPGNAFPEGTLAGKAVGADNAKLAGNEPDGDASGRPGSSTLKHIDAETPTADQNAPAAGQVKVKALKTVLYGGMAYTEGQTFNMDQAEFDARKDRGDFEQA
jgi:hypothetical protein